MPPVSSIPYVVRLSIERRILLTLPKSSVYGVRFAGIDNAPPKLMYPEDMMCQLASVRPIGLVSVAVRTVKSTRLVSSF